MLDVGESRHSWQPEPLDAQPTATTTTPRVLTILSSVLEKLVARNERLTAALTTSGVSPSSEGMSAGDDMMGKNVKKVFDGVRAPNISLPKYLDRIYKYIKCSPSCFVVAYVYIDRLVHKYPQFLVVSLNVHRLVVTSVLVASKMLDDEHNDNAFYARVGGVSNAELNKLELELLFLLDFQVVVSGPVFENYCLHLETQNYRIANSVTGKLPSPTSSAAASLIGINKDADDDGSYELVDGFSAMRLSNDELVT